MEKFRSYFFIFTKWKSTKYNKENYFKNKHLKFIDLSADFRISKAKLYEKNYKIKHNAKNLIKNSLYSIPEFSKSEIQSYRIILILVAIQLQYNYH